MLTSPVHKSPSLIACIPVIVGIKLGHNFIFSDRIAQQLLITSVLLLIICQFIKTTRRSYFNMLHLLLFIFAFFLVGHLRYQQVNKVNNFSGSLKGEFTATILSSPVAKAKSYRLDLMIDSAFTDSINVAVQTKIIAYIQKSDLVKSLLPGQRIAFSSVLNSPSKVMNPEDFDYKAFLQRKSIFATTYITTDNWKLLNDEHITLKILAARAQRKVVEILENLNYDKEEMALLSALTVGYKQMIGNDQRQAYVSSGATHVLAVSGLHVGIIFLFLTRLFKVFGKDRKITVIRLVITISLLWSFAFITGLTPSVSRATLMFTLVTIGTIFKQRSSIFNTVYFSALILLIINPQNLFDIGFQLSYCAVISIIAFQPHIASILHKKVHFPKGIADLIAVSIAAQLGTFPLSIHTFNCFPNYFIITNIWIIPLVGIIVNAAIILILTALAGLPTTWIAIPLDWSLKGMNMGVSYISRLPHALSSFLYVDIPTMTLLYIALITLIFALNYHSKHYLFAVFFCLIMAQGLHIYNQEKRKPVEQLMIFNDRTGFSISAQQGLRSNILCEKDSTIKIPSYFTHHFLARKTLDQYHLYEKYRNYNLCIYDNFVITPHHLHLIYNDEISTLSDHIAVTSLIIYNDEPQNIYRLHEHINFNTLIINQKLQKHENYYRIFCNKHSITLHLIYKDGAFIHKF